MPEILKSDISILLKIKKQQYRNQLPPLALLVLAFLISFFFSAYNLRYLSWGLSLIAFVWYLYVGFCHRYKEKIPAPEEGALLSPLTGKVRSLKRSSDIYQLRISKSFLDSVEIRCPHTSAEWDKDALRVVFRDAPLVFRFETEHLVKFAETEMQPGNIIGMIVGSAVCSLNLQQNLMTALKPGDICEGGFTPILD